MSDRFTTEDVILETLEQIEQNTRSIDVEAPPHQHGPYIVTEWQNIYVTAKKWSAGDAVGRPLDIDLEHPRGRKATRVRCANCLEEKEL